MADTDSNNGRIGKYIDINCFKYFCIVLCLILINGCAIIKRHKHKEQIVQICVSKDAYAYHKLPQECSSGCNYNKDTLTETNAQLRHYRPCIKCYKYQYTDSVCQELKIKGIEVKRHKCDEFYQKK